MFCEYRWELNHRHSMSWRTFNHAKGKNFDYPLFWNNKTEKLEIVGKGFHSDLPLDENGIQKDPLSDLENIITTDGRSGRRVITINGKFVGPTIKVKEGATVKAKRVAKHIFYSFVFSVLATLDVKLWYRICYQYRMQQFTGMDFFKLIIFGWMEQLE